jgi:hypothetical protein
MRSKFWSESLKRRERPLGRSNRRWEDNIKTDIREIVLEEVDSIYLAQDRGQCRAHVDTVMKILVP